MNKSSNAMSIAQAKKILGKKGKKMTDVQIEQDIETAILFKELFFEILSSQSQYSKLCNNKFDVNKTKSSNLC